MAVTKINHIKALKCTLYTNTCFIVRSRSFSVWCEEIFRRAMCFVTERSWCYVLG